MTRLDGSRVLVTGGSEGIGLEVARLALHCGAQVSVLARDAVKLAAAGPGLRAVQADVTDPDSLRDLPPVDVLVCCAGGAEPGHFLQLTPDQLRRQVSLNLLGAAFTVQAVLPGMLERGHGHVVLVSSAAGLAGVFGYGGYGPAKAGLANLAQVLRAEFPGVHVTVAYPPDTTTPGFARENATKPAQTHAVSALVKPVSAQRVAKAIVAGIERDRQTVTADPATALLARATTLVAPVARAQMRRAVRRATA